MQTLELKLVSFNAVPPDMKRLSELAVERGLSRSAYLRQLIHQTVLRAEKANG